MGRQNESDWWSLSMRSWEMGMDAAMVMGLRSMRIMGGGKAGRDEAARMVTEKINAAASLGTAFAAMGGKDAAAATDAMLDIYGPKVRRNRKRLSR